jgi:U3 small nucleolar ribonucleoprotein component
MTLNGYTIQCDSEKWNEIRRLGYSHAELHTIVMDMILSGEIDTLSYDLQINILKKRVSDQMDVIENTELRLKAEQAELEFLKEEIRKLQNEKKEDLEILELSRLMGRLNQIITVAGYSPVVVKSTASKIVRRIEELNPAFDLKKHCELLKKMI